MSIYKNGKLIAGGRQCMPLLSFMWADHILDNASWLHADTFSWQSGAVYQAAYAHLVLDIDGKTLQSETISGKTIQFYLADDGHKICPSDQESNVIAIYNTTGIAWYYIIDTANQRFKLPRTKFGFTGIRNGVGGFVEAGLPNITGTIGFGRAPSGNSSKTNVMYNTGAFYSSDTYTSGGYSTMASDSNSPAGNKRALFDASYSSSVYGNASTVQPKATQMYLYFYVGNFTQTALENTAGVTTETLNGKADLDLANVLANIDFVVERQEPTAANNYTWYKKYRSGWVEQGGRSSAVNGVGATTSVTLPVAMSDANYSAYVSISRDSNGDYRDQFLVTYNRTTTGFGIYSNWAGSDRGQQNNYGQWFVCGIAA